MAGLTMNETIKLDLFQNNYINLINIKLHYIFHER